jgi:hypothetical protein
VKKILTLSQLRTVALIVLLGGAVSSLVLVLHAGRNNKSILLPVLFVIWVLSPFIALLFANVVSKRWAVPRRMTLYSLMLVLTLGSLIGYSGILNPPGTKPAGVFLIVPLVSWVLIAIATVLSRRLSRRNDNV